MCVDKPFRPEWLAIFIVLLMLPLFTVVCSALQVYPSETPSIKSLEGSEAWKKVKTISCGDGLLAQMHGTICPINRERKNDHLHFISPNISPISVSIKLGISLYHGPINYCVTLLLD